MTSRVGLRYEPQLAYSEGWTPAGRRVTAMLKACLQAGPDVRADCCSPPLVPGLSLQGYTVQARAQAAAAADVVSIFADNVTITVAREAAKAGA